MKTESKPRNTYLPTRKEIDDAEAFLNAEMKKGKATMFGRMMFMDPTAKRALAVRIATFVKEYPLEKAAAEEVEEPKIRICRRCEHPIVDRNKGCPCCIFG